MNIIKYIGVVAFLLMCMGAQAQRSYKYRVYLKDKQQTEYSLEHPEAYLSQRALERRNRQGIKIDSTDLPVCRQYIDELVKLGATYRLSSKWNNTVLMEVADEAIAQRFSEMPFVRAVKKVWVKPDTIFPKDTDRKSIVTNKWIKKDDFYGVAAEQIRLHHGDSLHQAGFRGKGMLIGVIDAGYYNVDLIKLFKNVNIAGTRDFVNPDSDIYAEHYHGMKVLSCMAVNRPKVMVGTAPEAAYWLLRSEDNDTEQLSEEDHWAAAIEFADSVGVDAVNSSLGYYEFDNKEDWYRYRDLDGRTAMISRSADYAGDKGILVVCSAGNSGTSSWKKITPPADAENVLAIGAVDKDGLNADFSSLGNTADGRVKPDVMSLGYLASVTSDNGGTSLGNGTSFAAPIFCGLAVCLWQACPWLNVKELRDIICRSGDNHEYPDNVFGHGIPDIWKAYQMALEMKK